MIPERGFASFRDGWVLRTISQLETMWKSARFRVRAVNPYPTDYRLAFAYSTLLYPLFSRTPCEVSTDFTATRFRHWPIREASRYWNGSDAKPGNIGLTEFHAHDKTGDGSVYSPGMFECQRAPIH